MNKKLPYVMIFIWILVLHLSLSTYSQNGKNYKKAYIFFKSVHNGNSEPVSDTDSGSCVLFFEKGFENMQLRVYYNDSIVFNDTIKTSNSGLAKNVYIKYNSVQFVHIKLNSARKIKIRILKSYKYIGIH